MFPINWFPGTNMHDLDLDWIIRVVREMDITLKDFVTNYSNPNIVYSSDEMINRKLIYLYVGDEYGYNKNYWYYYNANLGAWTAGGLYGSAVVDDSLDEDSTNAVQNKVITEKINELSVFVTPEMFGAVGNDINDDTDALKAMFQTGLPVYIPNKAYLTTEELNYSGPRITGSGTIRSIMPAVHVINCSADDIEIDGIHVDCHNMSSIGIYCIGSNKCIIRNCTVENTENAELGAVACSGIYTTGYYTVKIESNKIQHINRTNQSPGVVSSTGIDVNSNGNIDIVNNFINDVKCSTQQTDCDGIYLTSSSNTAVANVVNNVILDPTGRFIKLQVNMATVRGNRCRLINTSASLFFKGIDFQYGGGSFESNYMDLSDRAGSSSMFIHADYVQNVERELLIKNNTFVCSTVIASFIHMEGTIGGVITIEDNKVFSSYINYVIRAGTTNKPTKVYYTNNDIPYYRLWHPDGSTDLQEIYLYIVGNRSTYTGNLIFATAVNINNIVIRNNVGMVEKLTNVTMDFNKMVAFCLEYQQSGVPITNYPSALGTPDHVFLANLSNSLFDFYNFGTGVRGVYTK